MSTATTPAAAELPPSHGVSSAQHPQEVLRDLMSLLALPALWVGKEGDTILQLMLEAVERIVPLTVSCVQASLLPSQDPTRLLRVNGDLIAGPQAAPWEPFVQACRCMPHHRDKSMLQETPLGPLRVIRLYLGSGPYGGSVWFASRNAAFPSLAQSSILRAAVSLAATGLHAARLNYEREQASRAKDEFLAMLGHELRNPLSPIVTALQLMRLRSVQAPSREQEIIERQVGHLTRLVDDLMDITRITQGRVELKLEAVDLRAILSEAIESVSPLLEQRRHRLTFETSGPIGRVRGDPARLRQVFVNLLNNAAKYTDPGGEINVQVSGSSTQVKVSVQDNGVGIEPKQLPLVFNLFQQGAVTLERARGGLGIGLAIVKNLVDLHHGTVSVQSEGAGHGSTFSVTLPLREELPAQEFPASPQLQDAGPGESLRVMLVDDNADALHLMHEALALQGFEVVSSPNPVEALSLAARFDPDIAVLDIGLPVMDGYELARQLRRTDSATGRLRLIALTGYGQQKDRARAMEAGFDSHLVKPVAPAVLIQTIKALCPAITPRQERRRT